MFTMQALKHGRSEIYNNIQLAFVFVRVRYARHSVGIKKFSLETPECWKTWGAIPDVAFGRINFLPLERYRETAAMNPAGWIQGTSDFFWFIRQKWGSLYSIYSVQMPVPNKFKRNVQQTRLFKRAGLCLCDGRAWRRRFNSMSVPRKHTTFRQDICVGFACVTLRPSHTQPL